MELGNDRVEEVQRKIADLKKRWPAHSAPPGMMQELDELEAELEEALKENNILQDDHNNSGDPQSP
jgi:hypothetical protein